MAVLFDNREFHTSGIESLLAPGFLAGGCLGSQLRMNCGDTHGGFHKFDVEEAAEDDSSEYPQPQAGKKRRLTGDQVRFLEKSFALENRLEPGRKVQLARDLGLKPRQVAIWFQNRRARWKTKQMEKEYESLKSSYDSLKVDCESLLKEKEKLQSEVAFLTRKLLHKEKNKKSSLKLQNRDSAVAVLCKQEDVSANSSIIRDSEIPRCIDGGGGFSKLVEPTSPMNPEAEIERAFGVGFGHRPELHSFSHEFQVEDQAFWFWS